MPLFSPTETLEIDCIHYTKLWPFLSKFMNSKWHHKFAKHNLNTTPWYVYQSVFKIFTSSFFSSPARSFWLSKSPSFHFLWCGLASICVYVLVLWGSLAGSLALWTTCSVPFPDCLPSGLCVAFWIYLLGSGSLVSLVGGVEWCYPPARFVLLHLSSLFMIICLLFILGLMPCCWCSACRWQVSVAARPLSGQEALLILPVA